MKHTIVLGAALAALLGFVRPADAQEQAPPPAAARPAVDSVRPAVDSVRPTLETARPAPDSVRFAPDYVPPAVRTEADLAPATSVAEATSVLGITVSTSGTARDTLGLLISPVVPGGAGDRGGIDPGNRLAEVNNVNLRIAPADIGRREPAEGAMRALASTLRTVRPGEWVRIRLFGGGRYRTVAIQTPRADTTPAGVGAAPSSLQRVVDGIGSLRGQLDQLMQAQTVPVPRDTLLRAERELGAIQRRLKAAQLAPRNIDNTVGSLPGLRVAAVAAEMKDYFGEGSEGGLLVLECDISWDPLRNGDVILRVNDEPANLDRLRVALDPQRESRIDFLRRGRYMMVTLHPRE